MSNTLFSLAFGVGSQNRQGAWLEVFYAQPLLNPSAELVAAVALFSVTKVATRPSPSATPRPRNWPKP